MTHRSTWEKTIEHASERPQGSEHGSNYLLKDGQISDRGKEIITARVYELQARGWKDYHRKRAMAWFEALSASIGRAQNLSQDLPTVGKLLWEQHVFGEPDRSQVLYLFALLSSGDRFTIIQTPGRVRRTVARLRGFLFQDVRTVLEADAEASLRTTHFWVYAPDARAQGRHR